MIEDSYSFPNMIPPSNGQQHWPSEESHLRGLGAEITLRRDSQKLRREIGRSRDFSPSSGCEFEMIIDQGSTEQILGTTTTRPGGEVFSNREGYGQPFHLSL
jgi:hypothetical protein